MVAGTNHCFKTFPEERRKTKVGRWMNRQKNRRRLEYSQRPYKRAKVCLCSFENPLFRTLKIFGSFFPENPEYVTQFSFATMHCCQCLKLIYFPLQTTWFPFLHVQNSRIYLRVSPFRLVLSDIPFQIYFKIMVLNSFYTLLCSLVGDSSWIPTQLFKNFSSCQFFFISTASFSSNFKKGFYSL